MSLDLLFGKLEERGMPLEVQGKSRNRCPEIGAWEIMEEIMEEFGRSGANPSPARGESGNLHGIQASERFQGLFRTHLR
jgi:hypothetical protein